MRGIDQTNSYVLAVTTTPKAWRGTNSIVGKRPRVKVALGFHPQLAHERQSELSLFRALLSETRYVGEIGLDGSKEFKKHLPEQKKIFSSILEYCEQADGKILSIHSRAAATLVLDLLEKHPKCGKPVLHWFTGSLREANRAIELGCYFSINSAMLKSQKALKTIEVIPRNRILTESDGPFIMNGNKPISPLDIGNTLKMLARTWNTPTADTDTQIMLNFGTLLTG